MKIKNGIIIGTDQNYTKIAKQLKKCLKKFNLRRPDEYNYEMPIRFSLSLCCVQSLMTYFLALGAFYN